MKKIIVVLVFSLVAGCASLDSGMVTARFHEYGQHYISISRYNAKRGDLEKDFIRVKRSEYVNYRLGDCIIVTKNGVKKIDSEAERRRITHGIE